MSVEVTGLLFTNRVSPMFCFNNTYTAGNMDELYYVTDLLAQLCYQVTQTAEYSVAQPENRSPNSVYFSDHYKLQIPIQGQPLPNSLLYPF